MRYIHINKAILHLSRIHLLFAIVLFPQFVIAQQTNPASAFAKAQLTEALKLQSSGVQVSPNIISQLREDTFKGGRDKSQTKAAAALYELELRTQRPEVLGKSLVKLTSLAEVGVNTSLIIEYRVGGTLSPGAGIMLGHHWMYPFAYQTSDPSGANYLKISTDKAGAVFSVTRQTWTGIHGGLESVAELPLLTLTEGQLIEGDLIVVSLNAPGVALPLAATKVYAFPLYVRLEQTTPFMLVPSNSLEISPGKISQIRLDADSIVRPGEDVNLRIRMEDRYGNLVTSDLTRSFDLLVNGVVEKQIVVTKSAQSIAPLSFSEEGVFNIEARSAGGGFRATANPVFVSSKVDDRILWVDFAAYSRDSDGYLDAGELKAAAWGKFDLQFQADHNMLVENSQNPIDATISNPFQDVSEGGSTLKLTARNGAEIETALAENPSDLRRLNPDNLRLAQIASPVTTYEWFVQAIASLGHKIGFVATNHSHLLPLNQQEAYTAIRIAPGQHWFDALDNGQTFVSVGSKILILTTGNGEPHRSVLPIGADRVLKAEFIAPMDILSIELMKNGTVLSRFEDTASLENKLVLSLFSSSEPFGRLNSKPRNGREWIGYISTNSALLSSEKIDYQSTVFRDALDQKRVDFMSRSHGNKSYIVFDILDAGLDTIFEVGIASGFEDTAWLPHDRTPSETPPLKFQFTFSELNKGVSRKSAVNGYTDQLTLSTYRPMSQNRRVVTYVDRTAAHIGDYYYFRVTLIDGSTGFSTPTFVGL